MKGALRWAAVLLIVVAMSACSGASEPAVRATATTPTSMHPDTPAEPTGVLLWLRDGARSHPPRLHALAVEGGGQTPVDLSALDGALDPSWSPDLLRLLWVRQPPDGVPGAEVLVGRPDGSAASVVGELRHPDDLRGRAWSNDGSRVAYATYTDTGAELRVVDAATGDVDVVRTWDVPTPVDVDWSPDDARLAVAVAEGPDAGIWTIAADGGDERAVSAMPAWRIGWSPNDLVLAVEAAVDGEPPGIYIVRLGTGDVRRLSPPGVLELGPVWSPDGAWLAFASEREAGEVDIDEPRQQPLIHAAVYVMRPDGSDVRQVVPTVERGWPETWDWFRDWPPDGVA